jgi:hypothetical protein
MAVDWLQDLIRKEGQLRRHLAALGASAVQPGSGAPAAGESFEHYVRPEIEEIQAALDDYLCGRGAEEQAWMSYEVRLNLPVFSHLRSLYALVSAAES